MGNNVDWYSDMVKNITKRLKVLPRMRGNWLDRHGEMLGVHRKRWWIFKEWDRFYRRRLTAFLRSF